MKYLITEKNIKWDNTYTNTMYFLNDIDRDNYINSELFTTPDYLQQLDQQPETYGVTLSPNGGTIEIQWGGSVEELFKKNTIILKESIKSSEPKFYFIDDIQQLDNNNMYELTLSLNLFLTYTGILKHNLQMNLLEGHVNDVSILDQVIDAGYKTPYSIKPLRRNFDFNTLFPDRDYNTLDNQWIYLFIKQSETSNLFKLNNQTQPFKLLVAPLNDILIEKKGDRNVMAYLYEKWDNVKYTDGTDENISGDQSQLENVRTIDLDTSAIQDKGDVKINFDYTHTDTGKIKNVVYIPYNTFTNFYKDKWEILHIGTTKSEYDKLNDEYWRTNSTNGGYNHIVAFEMRWVSQTNQLQFRALKRGNNTNANNLMATTIAGYHRNKLAIGGWLEWKTLYSNGDTNQNVENLLPVRNDFSHIPAHGGNSKWPYMATQEKSGSDGGKYEYGSKDWSFSLTEVYQGEDDSINDLRWTNDSLINYINAQVKAYTGVTSEIIGGKISSFNPLQLDEKGFPTNIKKYDSDDLIVYPDGWDNTGLYELTHIDTGKSPLLNTYDLKEYTNKSWIEGINAYSIIIENNKEFKFKPEKVYSEAKFVHSVIPLANEWTERIVWGGDIHTEDYEFINNKEFIFATNTFNDYQLNNPGELKNQAFNNNLRSVESIIEAMIGIGTGGLGAIAGVKSIGNTVVERINYKQNITMMKKRAPISSGSGSAYSDLYLNKNGFGLSIVEWQYTTPQCKSTIDSIIRNGISYDRTIVVNFESIKRPEYNYIKIDNGKELLTLVELTPAIKEQFANVFEKGVRLWYNADNYLKYDVENDTMFNYDMVKFIDWNTTT